MINLLNNESKLIYKTTTNKNILIKCSFLIFFEILLLIEKIKSENTSFFFINKQKNQQNNTNLYNNENKNKNKNNYQKEKQQNNKEDYNKENNDTKNGNKTQKEKEKIEEVVFKTLHESFNSAKDFLDKGIKGILIQDKQKFVLSEIQKLVL